MCEEHVILEISCIPIQRQNHLARHPRVSKAEELPLVLVALVRLQIFLPPIQRAACHRFLWGHEWDIQYSAAFFESRSLLMKIKVAVS